MSQFLLKAKKRLEETRVREAKEKALAAINKLILDQRMNEAEVELNRFAQNYPSEQATVKDLRRKIFSFGGTTAHTTVETPKRTRIGFNSPQSESNTEDEFFAIPETPKRAKQNTQQKRTIPITPKKTDDFFDNNSNRVGDHQPTKRTTNDDFNF